MKFLLEEGEWKVIKETLRESQVIELGMKSNRSAEMFPFVYKFQENSQLGLSANPWFHKADTPVRSP